MVDETKNPFEAWETGVGVEKGEGWSFVRLSEKISEQNEVLDHGLSSARSEKINRYRQQNHHEVGPGFNRCQDCGILWCFLEKLEDGEMLLRKEKVSRNQMYTKFQWNMETFDKKLLEPDLSEI